MGHHGFTTYRWQCGIIIKEEGSQVGSGITSLDFVGSTVSATASGTNGTITITAGGGGGGSILQLELEHILQLLV